MLRLDLFSNLPSLLVNPVILASDGVASTCSFYASRQKSARR